MRQTTKGFFTNEFQESNWAVLMAELSTPDYDNPDVFPEQHELDFDLSSKNATVTYRLINGG